MWNVLFAIHFNIGLLDAWLWRSIWVQLMHDHEWLVVYLLFSWSISLWISTRYRYMWFLYTRASLVVQLDVLMTWTHDHLPWHALSTGPSSISKHDERQYSVWFLPLLPTRSSLKGENGEAVIAMKRNVFDKLHSDWFYNRTIYENVLLGHHFRGDLLCGIQRNFLE